MASQGKCNACKIRVTWADRAPIKRVRCPRCGGGLVATSKQSKLEVVDISAGGDVREGDCDACGARFEWDKKFPAFKMRCPKCDGPLKPCAPRAKPLPVRDIGRLAPTGRLRRLSIRSNGQATAWSEEDGQLVAVPWAWNKKRKKDFTSIVDTI